MDTGMTDTGSAISMPQISQNQQVIPKKKMKFLQSLLGISMIFHLPMMSMFSFC